MWYTIPLAAVVRVTLGTGGENDGILGYLWERDDGEVGCCRACVGELPHHQLRGDVSAGQGQETRRLLLKEALNIQVTPAEEHFNQVPRLLMWRQVGRVFRTFFAFALTITKVFNWNVDKKVFLTLSCFRELSFRFMQEPTQKQTIQNNDVAQSLALLLFQCYKPKLMP